MDGLGSTIPRLIRADGCTHLVVDGARFVMLGGEVHNSSSSSLAYMEEAGVWDSLIKMKANTALVPLSWELIEPEEGRFDFELVDGLIAEARKRGLRLVFLWFGTWKNAESWYVPEWVKTDLERFPRAQNIPGVNTEAISAFSEAACRADSRAFAAVMQRIREVDYDRTVIMMQVENEVGILGSAWDRSPLAEAAFAGEVPEELIQYLSSRKDYLLPETLTFWGREGYRTCGTWADVFGDDAAEVFMAWYTAKYVNKVAEAGRAAYPLPMCANAWLVQYQGQPPGAYPSGGPVHKVMDIWRAAAPAIDVLAPDIYIDDFKRVCAQYARGGNPLFIPETRRSQISAATAYYAVGRFDAICFAPFGIDSAEPQAVEAIAETFHVLGDMMHLITKYQGTGRMVGFYQAHERMERFDLGGYRLIVSYTQDEEAAVPARGLIIALQDGEFLVAGAGFSVEFQSTSQNLPHTWFLAVDEGWFEDGRWIPRRRLNGDEWGVRLGSGLSIRRVRVYSHR